MLIRVRKADVKADSWIDPDGVDTCLACWKIYMGSDDKDLGVKGMSGLASDTDGYGVDASETQRMRDMRIGHATDAMIDSLKRFHIWAIYTLCSVPTPWSYPNADITIVGPQAMDELKKKLKENVATGVLF